MATARQTRRPAFSTTSPTRSGPRFPDAVDLEPGPDGVWVEAQPGRLVVDSVELEPVQPAAVATARAGVAVDQQLPRALVITNGPANGCALCGRKAVGAVTLGFVQVKVCAGCKTFGSKLLSMFK